MLIRGCYPLQMASKHQRVLDEEVDVARFTKGWQDLNVIEKRLKNKATLSSHLKALAKAEMDIDANLASGGKPDKRSMDKLQDVYITTPNFKNIQRQAAILLATCNWRLDNPDHAITLLKEACSPPPTQVSEGSPRPLLQYCKLQAQGYACFGLCYEQTGQAESAISCYQLMIRWLAQISLHIEQQTRGLSAVNGKHLFYPELNLGLTRGSLLLLKLRNVSEAISFCRNGMRLHDCNLFSLQRDIAAVCLSNILVFQCPGNRYDPPTAEPRPPTFQRPVAPSCVEEEAILVLSIIANHNLAPDTHLKELERRYHSYSAVWDLSLLEYACADLTKALACTSEASMPYTAVSKSPWADYLLSLLLLQRDPIKLELVAKQVVKEVTDRPWINLLAADTMLKIDKPLSAREIGEACIAGLRETPLLASVHHTIATACLTLHRLFPSSADSYLQRASEHIQIASEMDPRNIETLFVKAFVFANQRELKECRSLCRRGIVMESTHKGMVHLLASMLTSERKYREALDMINFVFTHWPRSIGLMMSKIELVLLLEGPQEALRLCRNMMQSSNQGEGEIPKIIVGSSDCSPSENSEQVSSSSGIGSTKHTSRVSWLWCKTTEIFLSQGQLSDATESLHEAQQLTPNALQVVILRGKLKEVQGNLEDARMCYHLALSMAPRHLGALIAMASLLVRKDCWAEAERHVKQAMEYDPKNHKLWGLLATILQSNGETAKSIDCFSTALSLEQQSILLPLSHISHSTGHKFL